MRVAFLCLLLLPAVALAGDPCPIGFVFHDPGPPPWLDQATLFEALDSKDSWVGVTFDTRDGGVRVVRVYDDSPAAKAGLKKGDVIQKVGDRAVTKHEEVGALFRDLRPGAKVTLTLQRGPVELMLGAQDPLIGALVDHASSLPCARVGRARGREAIRDAVFTKAKRFRCKDAHRALRKHGLEGGDIVVVRGRRRVLLANVGWRTECVNAADYDGGKLVEKAVFELFRRLTGAFVADRHANP